MADDFIRTHQIGGNAHVAELTADARYQPQ